MSEKRIEVTCPCCQARLLVDSASGLVLQTLSRKTAYSFDEALQKEKDRKSRSDQLFAKAFDDEKRRQETLEEKYRAALRSKEDLEEPPPRPLDLD